MTTLELKKQLIHQIAEIDDETFLKALKTILDAKSQAQVIVLNPEQRMAIEASKKQIKQGLYIEQTDLDKEFMQWLNAK